VARDDALLEARSVDAGTLDTIEVETLKTEMRNDVAKEERGLFELPGAALGFILASRFTIEATRGHARPRKAGSCESNNYCKLFKVPSCD
jgi:hypothetical protein